MEMYWEKAGGAAATTTRYPKGLKEHTQHYHSVESFIDV